MEFIFNDENAQERIRAKKFSINDDYSKYDKRLVKTGYGLEPV